MLADLPIQSGSGSLDKRVQLPDTARHELFELVANALPHWRDDRNRPEATAEPDLNDQLSAYLNDVCRKWDGWGGRLQFARESRDEVYKNRNIDVAVKPTEMIVIDDRTYNKYQMLFPIECKRLPTPETRDEREYVVTEERILGGIQRFKMGFHGADHAFAAMIGYVQKESFPHWLKQINGWIGDLAGVEPNWSSQDCLQPLKEPSSEDVYVLQSRHKRAGAGRRKEPITPLGDIELRHAWIKMN